MWAEQLQAEIDSIANFVHQVESEYRAAERAAQGRAAPVFEEPIKGDLGSVRVNSLGFLVDVTLTTQNLRGYRGGVLAERILRAVACAAERADRARETELDSR
jgi:hypothetical protein